MEFHLTQTQHARLEVAQIETRRTSYVSDCRRRRRNINRVKAIPN